MEEPVVTPFRNQAESESLIKCSRCHNAEVFFRLDICPSCELIQERKRGLNEKRAKDNERRRLAFIDDIGEHAVKNWTLDTFKPYDDLTSAALEIAKSFVPSIHNLYLCGITGSGKSHLAVALTMKAFEEGKIVHFFSSGPDLIRRFKGKIEVDEEVRRIKELADADLLVINELGIGRDTEFSVQIAVEVIDKRIMRGKNGLIITSNYHPVDLAKKMNDSRLESRFTGLCKIIEVGREDYRKARRVA